MSRAGGGDDVEALIDAVERVADGDYTAAFELDRDDDLGDLADALGEMTDRVAAREAALEGEIEYTADVLDAIDDVFYVLDREGEHSQWNQTLVDVSGYDHEEIPTLHPVEYFDGEDRERIAEWIDTAFEDGHARTEATLQTKSGESIPFEWIANRLTAPDGTTVVAGIGRDVSARKERERELREREGTLQRHKTFTDEILDSIDDVFYVVGPDFSLQRWNRSMREATGYSDAEIAEMHPTEFVVDEDAEDVANAVAGTFETGSARTEARVETKGGETIPYEFIGSLLESPEGGPVLVGVGRDVTERVEREHELQRTRYLLGQAEAIAHVGGWELDLRTDPPTFEGTDEFYDIHDLPRDEPVDVDAIIDHYHSDDRERIRKLMTDAIEDASSYDMEVRLSPATDAGDRWVRAIAEPVVEDGEVVALRGSVQEITDRKENELRLEALHDVARGLLEAEERSVMAELVVEAAVSVLEPPCIAVYLFEEDTGRLEPAATSEHFRRVCEDPTAGYDADGAELLWDVFVGGDAVAATDGLLADSTVLNDSAGSALVVPIGEHGVLLVATDRDAVSEGDRRLAETVVATMEAALSRLESEAALRANQEQLEAQNRRLRRQIQITEIIRRVDRSLVGASTREEIESAVCERLTESDDVAFAWIGALDEADRTLVPRAWAGAGHEYLDAISLSSDASAPDPAVRTAVDVESVVVRSVVESVTTEEWRKHALVWDFASAMAVPLELEEYSYGVLAVYAPDAGAFGDLERSVFEELGESIANAINAVEARRALYADEFVELRLRVDGEEEFLGRVASAVGATVEYVGLATHGEDESRLFFEVGDAEPADVRAVLADRHAVTAYRQIGEVEGDRTLFEATVAGTVLAARLVERGGVPRSMVADDADLEVVVDVPVATDVREFVEMLRERYPSVELLARRNVTRDVQTRQELVAGLFDGLTDRQLEVLRTAFFAGFFEWPRESTGEDVADLLEVSQPTVNRHLRHALARLLEQLFEAEPTTVSPA